MSRPIARRYARALFALTQEKSVDPETVTAELAAVAEAFASDGIAEVVASGALDLDRRRALAASVRGLDGVSTWVGNLVALLAENNRLAITAEIRDAFAALVDEALGRLRGRIVSARPLSDEDLDRVRAAFSKRTGRQVLADNEIDPELLGGLVVELGGRVYDGSIRTRLERMRGALSG